MSRSHAFSDFVLANGRLNQEHFNQLSSLGVPTSAWFGVPSLIGYWSKEKGIPLYVAPIGEGASRHEWSAIYDLVGFTPSTPDRWRLRYGLETMLGPDWPAWCRLHEEPLKLFSNPLSWLRASGQGSCIVDWSMNLRLALGNLKTIDCDTAALAEKVSTAFHSPKPIPSIRVLQALEFDDVA